MVGMITNHSYVRGPVAAALVWDDIARVTDALIDVGEDEKALALLPGHR